MLTGGAGVRAMARAFEDVFGVRDGLHGVPMAGRTDAWILAQAVAAHDLPCDSEMVLRFRERYLTHLADEVGNAAGPVPRRSSRTTPLAPTTACPRSPEDGIPP